MNIKVIKKNIEKKEKSEKYKQNLVIVEGISQIPE